MGGRSEADKPLSVVGQELFHGLADRTRAISMLSMGFQSLSNDLAVWQTANQSSPDATAILQWLAADVTPTLDEWRDFVVHEGKSWWAKLATNWETFEEWRDRLRQLRALARAHGILLQSAEPMELPKTVWQRSAEGKGSEATALLGLLKIGTAAILALMGAAGLYEVIRKVRPKEIKDNRASVRQVIREELSRKRR